MNKDLGLRLLSEIMNWNEEEARTEFHWLNFMATYKYNSYNGFQAGARFLESLARWLQQFRGIDRRAAYSYIRNKLIFFSAPEIHRLIEKFFVDDVQPTLVAKAARAKDIPNYLIWASEESIKEYQWECRKTLFMGLSDGAQIDVLRRANSEILSNEQIVISTQIDENKWSSLLEDLRSDLKNYKNTDTSSERFSRVYLLDDFIASGTSLLRNVKGSLDGKLVKFIKSMETLTDRPFSYDFVINVHHYVGTNKAHENVTTALVDFREKLCQFRAEVKLSYGMILPDSIVLGLNNSDPFANLCQDYYDDALEAKGKHGEQSGTTNRMFGYADCGLPVVFVHNTPNNTVPLIWAETQSSGITHNMVPLFRRQERHSDLDQGIESKS